MLIATLGEKNGLSANPALAIVIFVNLRHCMCPVEAMLRAVHSRIIALLHNTERCSSITVLIIETLFTRFASIRCLLVVRAAFPAFIANFGVMLIIVITLSLFSFIFTIHVDNRGRCLKHFGCRMRSHSTVLSITQLNLIQIGAR